MSTTDDTRTRILLVAAEAFSKRGFQGATVRDICRAAGANLASVNYYFGDKERLYVEAIRCAATMTHAAAAIPDWGPTVTAEQKLYDFTRATLERMISEAAPWQAQLILREVLEPTSACAGIVEEFIRPHFELLLSIVNELAPEGMSERERRHVAFGVIAQCLFYRFQRPVIELLIPEDEWSEGFAAADLAERIARFTLATLAGNAPQEQRQSMPRRGLVA